MTTPKHLAWDNFRATVLVNGERRIHRVMDTPLIDLFADGTKNQIGVLMEVGADAALPASISRLAFIDARLLTVHGRHLLEVSTSRPGLHHEFYHLSTAAAERVLNHSQEPVAAIDAELSAFAALLESTPLLGTEREIGLLGELLFLQELVSRHGPGMLDTWLGPTAEPHDFRLGAREYEVKTTLSPRRVHTINGAEQLLPSQGCTLYLVSTVLGPPGSGEGFSLSSTAARLAAAFAIDGQRAKQFEALLAACNYSLADAPHYARVFTYRRPTALVPVDAGFPAITRPAIQQILGPLAARVDSFRYDVSVEGLELECGRAEYDEALRINGAA